MITKFHSWKSYTFLIISLLVTATIFLLDPIATITSERITPTLIVIIIVGTLISILMAIITFRTLSEKKIVPTIATIITIFNTSIILFFLYFGSNFS